VEEVVSVSVFRPFNRHHDLNLHHNNNKDHNRGGRMVGKGIEEARARLIEDLPSVRLISRARRIRLVLLIRMIRLLVLGGRVISVLIVTRSVGVFRISSVGMDSFVCLTRGFSGMFLRFCLRALR
jgi:hypothetical protein